MFTSKLQHKIGTLAIVFMLVFGNVQPAFAATNDDFSAATVISSLPYSANADTTGATFQTGEPYPGCGYGYTPKTIWFSYTPNSNVTLIARANYYYFPPLLAVYSGTSMDALSPIGCGNYYAQVAFQAQAGVTYYFQLTPLYEWDQGIIPFSLEVAPPPNVGFSYSPYDPSTYDSVNFSMYFNDPAGIYNGTYAWNLGDGTTSTAGSISHQYAKDGDYPVSATYTTADGRTGTSSSTLQVRTRDVAINKLSVPQTAKSNTTKEITVEITNRRYSGDVQVQLYKGLPGGNEQSIGTLTIYVPARTNRSTLFKFSYTFTGCDAEIGKVTFRAAAIIMNGRDALPADNTAIKTTLVSGPGTCSSTSYP